jgi:two-component system OmpR family response regulator
VGRAVPAIRVLVVDDDEGVADFIATLLEKDGFEVGRVTDPTQAEEALKDGYHIAVLDLMMPKLDGLEVLKRIRSVDSDVSVIMATGHPSLETAVSAMKLDAVDYIRKPFNPEELRAAVDRIIEKKGLLRSPEELLNRHIGETIRNLRKERDLTLKQLARRTSLSVSLLSQIERAESSASIGSLYRIAGALDVGLATFFGDF